MQRYATVEKAVGQTPLEAIEKYRIQAGIAATVPMSYAGRLDPMASGSLLVLIGEECKNRSDYLSLDKEYKFEVLLGVGSDTGDVLGLLTYDEHVPEVGEAGLRHVAKKFSNTNLQLPYPVFSSKTVHGKPLHTWAMEGRLNEIEIPTTSTHIHKLQLQNVRTVSKSEVYKTATTKIETIPPVTQLRKALGNDFRRPDVRTSWKTFLEAQTPDTYTVATFRCIASSGTYMRSLSEVIGHELSTNALAYSIHRTKIGRYQSLPLHLGFWRKTY